MKTKNDKGDKVENLTNQQIRDTIRKLKMAVKIKAELWKQCYLNDKGAKFYIYSKWLEFNRNT